MMHSPDHEMVDESSLCNHYGQLSLEDEILENVINNFIAMQKPPSHFIILVVHSLDDMVREELS